MLKQVEVFLPLAGSVSLVRPIWERGDSSSLRLDVGLTSTSPCPVKRNIYVILYIIMFVQY